MQLTDDQLLLSPSDLNDFVECRHLTQLNLRVKRGELEIEPTASVEADLLSRKGDEHERAYLEQLKAEGRDVFEVAAIRASAVASLRLLPRRALATRRP